eukprot:CAMPEP_0195600818 /NCGR_PEP_ID=MMETSP0815-20121206/4756_1 /TAXON_ID=97485 /ORGANISM="Prymnesium parvum, Strain Texoma1" /LENGTH=143 /DNA_ID=CAMNT_0040740321 /DNA_START=344 /DNA_END=772 /DNA_ORIENTATION=-
MHAQQVPTRSASHREGVLKHRLVSARVLVIDGLVEGRVPPPVGRIDGRVILDEQLADAEVPPRGGEHQAGAPVVVGGVRVGSCLEVAADERVVALACSVAQLARELSLFEPEPGAMLPQQRDRVVARVEHRLEQRRAAEAVDD